MRLTLHFLCNMDGSHKEIFAIGSAKKPKAFKGKTIPVQYYSLRKASQIWVEILSNVNHKLKNKKIVLLVDNAGCHKIPDGVVFENINMVYLPPNTTSLIQPLDQGIIRCFKAYYRTCLIRKQLIALDSGKNLKEFTQGINILDALNMVKRAWWLIKPDTIRNCFRKASFTKCSVENDTQNDDVEEVLNVPMNEKEFEEYVNCDSNVECYGVLTDEEIAKSVVMASEAEENETGEIETEENFCLNQDIQEVFNVADMLDSITNIRNYFFKNNRSSKVIDELEHEILETCTANKNIIQKKISDYYTISEK